MPSLTCFNFRFTSNWLMLILAAFFFFLFICLGFWQIHRADEKTEMIVAQQVLAKQEPIIWKPGQKLPEQYQRISLEGTFLPELFLLDNQHYQHQFGYDVVSPLLLADDSIVMVDRGWVSGDITRRTFPNVQTPHGRVKLLGAVYFPSKKQWVLGPSFEEKENKVTILELIDEEILKQLLQKKVYPFIIRLDKNEPFGFVREWEIVSMPPQRHFAYAIQWFAMALVILIIFVILNLKKNEKTI
ncbi:TPA: SURF1 family protein [Legionella pneumophila]|nr:SURF1 family protein [Legionella pneumophila]